MFDNQPWLTGIAGRHTAKIIMHQKQHLVKK